jgi:hypothetical protein
MPEKNDDLDFLADFVLRAVKTGDVNILQAMKLPPALKRQAGKLDQTVGHIVRRYAREDEKASALIDLAVMQSPAFKSLAERWGLIVTQAEGAPPADAKSC